MENTRPNLIEIDTKFYLNNSLKKVRMFKDKYIMIISNIILLLLFFLLFGSLLYFKYKGKLTPEEIKKKEEERKNYIFTKMQHYSLNKLKEKQELITDLPIL
jgi:hypothetical protein